MQSLYINLELLDIYLFYVVFKYIYYYRIEKNVRLFFKFKKYKSFIKNNPEHVYLKIIKIIYFIKLIANMHRTD